MRATSVLRVLLALKHTRVLGFEFDDDALVVDVAPTWKLPRCAACKKVVHSGYDTRERRWRHLDMGGIKVLLRYSLRRVECETCGVVVEHVPWAESASRFTLPMEGHIAYHAQRTDQTTVTKLLRIAWRTVGTVVGHAHVREGSPGQRCRDGDPPNQARQLPWRVELRVSSKETTVAFILRRLLS
jgi:transposase